MLKIALGCGSLKAPRWPAPIPRIRHPACHCRTQYHSRCASQSNISGGRCYGGTQPVLFPFRNLTTYISGRGARSMEGILFIRQTHTQSAHGERERLAVHSIGFFFADAIFE